MAPSLCVTTHTQLDDGAWIILRFLVDSGAVSNVLDDRAIPASMHRRMPYSCPLTGVNGSALGNSQTSATLGLQFDVMQPETNISGIMKVNATLQLASLPKSLGIDGLLSYRWLAQRLMMIDPANTRLVIPQNWHLHSNMYQFSNPLFNPQYL